MAADLDLEVRTSGAWFRTGISGKARDFNWHNVIGLWCAVPLFFVVAGALVISYPWASNLVYRLAGSQPRCKDNDRKVHGVKAHAPGDPADSGRWAFPPRPST